MYHTCTHKMRKEFKILCFSEFKGLVYKIASIRVQQVQTEPSIRTYRVIPPIINKFWWKYYIRYLTSFIKRIYYACIIIQYMYIIYQLCLVISSIFKIKLKSNQTLSIFKKSKTNPNPSNIGLGLIWIDFI